jgi:hypothetical protein
MASQEKRAKGGVRYSYGMEDANCGICRHFREVALGLGECVKVKGVIECSMWCTMFKAKNPKPTQG